MVGRGYVINECWKRLRNKCWMRLCNPERLISSEGVTKVGIELLGQLKRENKKEKGRKRESEKKDKPAHLIIRFLCVFVSDCICQSQSI